MVWRYVTKIHGYRSQDLLLLLHASLVTSDEVPASFMNEPRREIGGISRCCACLSLNDVQVSVILRAVDLASCPVRLATCHRDMVNIVSEDGGNTMRLY